MKNSREIIWEKHDKEKYLNQTSERKRYLVREEDLATKNLKVTNTVVCVGGGGGGGGGWRA
jgi:hypothetical protein